MGKKEFRHSHHYLRDEDHDRTLVKCVSHSTNFQYLLLDHQYKNRFVEVLIILHHNPKPIYWELDWLCKIFEFIIAHYHCFVFFRNKNIFIKKISIVRVNFWPRTFHRNSRKHWISTRNCPYICTILHWKGIIHYGVYISLNIINLLIY